MPTVLITGAGRGLGLEFARQYAAEGWKVIGTVRDPRAGTALAALGKDVEVQLADMADMGSIARLGRTLAAVPIDVLICNAGIYGPRDWSFGRTDYAAFAEVLRINLLAPLAVAEALAGSLAAGAQKKIVMLSSGMGSIARNDGGDPIYRASKAALNSLAVSLAAELKDRRITVVAVSPGWARTDMGGPNAPVDPKDSIRGLRRLIAALTPARSGSFLSYDASTIPW